MSSIQKPVSPARHKQQLQQPAVCLSCKHKDKQISRLEDRLEASLKNVRSLSSSLKQSQSEMRQKDSLICQLMSRPADEGEGEEVPAGKTPLTSSQQQRIAELEASISQLSTICGEYKVLRTRDRLLIDSLTHQVQQMGSQSRTSETGTRDGSEIRLFRSRAVQTDAMDRQKDQPVIRMAETGTQTDAVADTSPAQVTSQSRKPELAVVMPTSHSVLPDSSPSPRAPESRPESYPVPPVIPLIPSKLPSTPDPKIESQLTDVLKLPLTSYFKSGKEVAAQEAQEAEPSEPSIGTKEVREQESELDRKERELTEARRQARAYESALRELQWSSSVERFRLKAKVSDYEKAQNQRAKESSAGNRQKNSAAASILPADQANLVYVRNVLLQYIKCKDSKQKKVMLNAVLTALDVRDER